MEPWNDKEFMSWAFNGEPISLGMQGYHKILDKLYETYEENKKKIYFTEKEHEFLLCILQMEKRRVFDYITKVPTDIYETDRENVNSIINKLSEKKCEKS